MAIVKLGELVAGIRGTVGAVTFSANKSAAYCKLCAMPRNPRSQLQSAARTFQSNCRNLWLDLTDDQRDAWDTFAALPAQALSNSLGVEYFASGWNWFTKCNSRLQHAGLSTIADAPVVPRPAAPALDELFYLENGAVFTAVLTYPTGDIGDDSLVIFAYVVPGGAPVAPYPSRLRFLNVVNAPGPAGFQIVLSPQHVVLWGYPSAGWLLYIHAFQQTPEGIRSAPTPISAVYPTA